MGDLLTAGEAALLVGHPVATVRSWVTRRRGLVPAGAKFWGSRRLPLFRRADVLRVAADMAAAPTAWSRWENDPEPTAEEVERTVREQMTRLPSWWHLDERRMAGATLANLLLGD